MAGSDEVWLKATDVEQFAKALAQYNKDAIERNNRLRSQLKRLGDTWRDHEYARFSQEFEQAMKAMSRFLAVSEGYVPHLLRKAQKAREVHQH